MDITLAVDKRDMGWVSMYLGWAGWGAERANGLCAPFPLFCFPACPPKVRNGNCEIVSEDARESRSRRSRVYVVERGFLHKCAKVHNNTKSEHLLLKRKVTMLGVVDCQVNMLLLVLFTKVLMVLIEVYTGLRPSTFLPITMTDNTVPHRSPLNMLFLGLGEEK